jgi:hypothetical protein
MNMAVFWVVVQYCLVGYKLTDISDVLSAAVIRAISNVRWVKTDKTVIFILSAMRTSDLTQ